MWTMPEGGFEKNIGNIISDVLSDKAWIILRQIETGGTKKEDLQIGRELLQKAYYIAVARRKRKCQILRNAYRKRISYGAVKLKFT